MKPLFNRTPLAPAAMAALPIGKIIPRGWLRNQLYLQAISITGHLDEIWEDLGPENGWLGGKGESWERGPYYCDGLVPLAYLLNDTALIAKARRWVEWSIASQLPSGSFGPQISEDPWPRTVMLKALIQYHSATGDTRIPQLVTRYFEYLYDWLQHHEMVMQVDNQWASYRAGDLLYALVWLYNLNGNTWLLEIGKSITEKSIDWTKLFNEFPYKEKALKWEYPNHVVNNAMGIKEPVFRYLFTHEESHKTGAKTGIMNLMKYHGLPNGIFSGDENLAGTNPAQGTETCAVAEYLFSLELVAFILGDAWYGDLIEKIAFNALPGCFTPDMWGHCYDQQPNGVLISQGKRNWSTNGDDANLMGLEPNFGCCTANLHQGWPKFAASLWGELPDGGLAVIAYAPCEVLHKTPDGTPLELSVITEYPFRERVQIKVSLEKATQFTLALRIPGWCRHPVITLNGKSIDNVPTGEYVPINRTWSKDDVIELYFPMEIQVQRGYHESVSIERGPLVYSLKMGESWQKLKGSEPCPDWEVHPTMPWNYGLKLQSRDTLDMFTVMEKPISFQPFDSLNSPIELMMQGYLLPDWKIEQNSAGEIPINPQNVNQTPQTITLIPYGAAKLRITSFPLIQG